MNEPFDLPHLISDVIADVQAAADDKGVYVAAHNLAAMPQWVEADEAALRRMLLNTLDLVVGAAPEGDVTVRLDPQPETPDLWTCVVAWRGGNTGPIHEVNTSFIVALRPATGADAAGPYRILVVDDSAQHRSIVTAYLAPTAHQVTEADTGEEALARVRAGAFDVVLMDVQMPGIGGIEAIREIRELELAQRRPRAYIVALSSMGARDDATDAEFAGADECLPKPLGRDTLFRMLSTVPAPVPVMETTPEPLGMSEGLAAAPLLEIAAHQLRTILLATPATQVERLRMFGHQLSASAAAAQLSDIAHLASALEEAAATGSLSEAQTKARTLQAWVLRSRSRT